jgi:NADH-ubiquinone oxidoreductase chain 1
MLYTQTIISIIEVLAVTIPVLLTVAFVTVAERKTMASMQRRLGPNIVGQQKHISKFFRCLPSL